MCHCSHLTQTTLGSIKTQTHPGLQCCVIAPESSTFTYLNQILMHPVHLYCTACMENNLNMMHIPKGVYVYVEMQSGL